MICTLRRIIFGWSNQGWWAWWLVWQEWG